MGTRLYVGNLPFNTAEDELKLSFSQCGSVREVKIIIDRETGRSRGFGFITMGSEAEAKAAIERWNGTSLGGRDLVVNEAQDKPRAGGGGGSRGGYGGPPPDPDRKGGGGRRGGRRGGYDDFG